MDQDRVSDETLLSSAASDPRAFEEIYRRHVGRVVAFAARRCRTPDEVHDLVGAIWLEVIAAAPRFDALRGQALPWILGVAANLVADRRRRKEREAEALRRLAGWRVLDDDDHARLEAMIDAERAAQPLIAGKNGLPAGERIALELVVLEGLNAVEVGEVLDVEPAAVRMRLARARRKLRADPNTEVER
jgi:RNA polymerase sigma-70 factor (ECF subfamily)